MARDLRSLEDHDEDDQENQTSLAAPMMLVLSILLGSRGASATEMSIGERALFDSLKSYQWAVEREIVTRLTGVGGNEDMDILLRRLAEITDNNAADPIVA